MNKEQGKVKAIKRLNLEITFTDGNGPKEFPTSNHHVIRSVRKTTKLRTGLSTKILRPELSSFSFSLFLKELYEGWKNIVHFFFLFF